MDEFEARRLAESEFTVRIQGDGYDDEIGVFRVDDKIDWDTVIRRVSGRLGPFGGGYRSATVRRNGPYPITIRITAEDAAKDYRDMMDEIHRREAALQAAHVPDEESIFDGDEDDATDLT